jgi:iron complex transport system substrate-binding protein
MRKITLAIFLFLFSQNLFAKDSAQPRVISIGGANTEIIYALGKGDLLIAADTTSYFPEAANKLTKIGYQRTLSAEGILSLKPDIIITTSQAGPAQVLLQLQEAGVKLVKLEEKFSIENTIQHIRTIAEVLEAKKEGEKLIAKLQSQMKENKNSTKNPSVIFILQAGQHGSPLIAGKNTAADGIITLSGAKNVVTQYEGYKSYNPESLISANPDVILTTSQTIESIGGKEKFLALSGLNSIAAGKEKRLIIMDSMLLLGFGLRTPEALKILTKNYQELLK